MSNVREFVPNIYTEVKEMDELVNTYDKLLDITDNLISTFEKGQFVSTADVTVIAEWEKLLGIIPKSTDTLEFRRERVINRLSMSPPFSMPYLRQRFDKIIGIGKYNAYIDYDNYTLYVESSAENQYWAEEIYITINKLKPANIVFINKPLIVYNNNVSEEIELKKLVYNYKVGTTWVLGRKPFVSQSDEGVIKMANINSLQAKFLNDIATFSANDINNVLLNDTYTISSFTTKSATDNVVTIEYNVPASANLGEITSIKLRDSNNNILTSSTIYVPLNADIVIKHKLNVKEGA